MDSLLYGKKSRLDGSGLNLCLLLKVALKGAQPARDLRDGLACNVIKLAKLGKSLCVPTQMSFGRNDSCSKAAMNIVFFCFCCSWWRCWRPCPCPSC